LPTTAPGTQSSSQSTPTRETLPRSILKRHSSVGGLILKSNNEAGSPVRAVSDRGVSFSQRVTVAAALDKGERFRCKYNVRIRVAPLLVAPFALFQL
jgi:hypothetical protein